MTQKNQGGNTIGTEQAPHKENTHSSLFDGNLVVNVAEVIANEKIAEVMNQMDICKCSRCTADVLAIALNSLPTKYVTTDAGKQYIQLTTYKMQFETDVVSALIKACMIVKDSPNHDE